MPNGRLTNHKNFRLPVVEYRDNDITKYAEVINVKSICQTGISIQPSGEQIDYGTPVTFFMMNGRASIKNKIREDDL